MVDDDEQRALDATRSIRDEALALADVLTEFAELYSGWADRLEAGTRVAELVRTAGWRAHRERLSRSLEQFSDRRHRWRMLMTAASLADGMTITAIAACTGISRQLASRYAAEARREADGRVAADGAAPQA
jgi:hypothetical protein